MSEMEIKRNAITLDGLKKMQERLEYLKTTGRAQIAEQIAVARSYGDLSENAEYDAAKDEQSKLEGEIVELEMAIRTAVVVSEEDITTEKVNVGTTIRVYDEEEHEGHRRRRDHLVIVGRADEEGVGEVVYHRDELAYYSRYSQSCQSLRDRHGRE